MFGKPSKADLRAENLQLREEITAIKSSNTFQLAQGIQEDIDRALQNEDGMYAEIQEAAIERRRAEELHRRLGQIAESRAEEVIEAERRKIEEEAIREAEAVAFQSLQRFLNTEAEQYRASIRAREAERLSKLVIAKAKTDILAEEGLVDAATSLSTHGSTETREQRKERATELRRLTKKSHILPLSMLQNGDEITIGFTQPGRGMEPLTDSSYGWSSTYRSQLEERKITFEILDSQIGLVRVQKDSWLNNAGKREKALRGGRQCIISSLSPETGEHEPILVKAGALSIEPLEGTSPQDEPLDLWWANLDEFRALS